MKSSYFSPDIQDFLLLLALYEVRYVIVGGEAVIYYGHARLTGDVDFFFSSDAQNAQQLFQALEEFWDGKIPGVNRYEELMETGVIIQFGAPPNRIDLLSNVDGIPFEQAWKNRSTTILRIKDRDVPIYFIGVNDLITNKQTMKRPKDLDDLKYLKALQEKQK